MTESGLTITPSEQEPVAYAYCHLQSWAVAQNSTRVTVIVGAAHHDTAVEVGSFSGLHMRCLQPAHASRVLEHQEGDDSSSVCFSFGSADAKRICKLLEMQACEAARARLNAALPGAAPNSLVAVFAISCIMLRSSSLAHITCTYQSQTNQSGNVLTLSPAL